MLTFSINTSTYLTQCSDYFTNHPVKSDIMLQIVLKSYGYYEGKIDGQFGTNSKKALIQFQGQPQNPKTPLG